MEDRYIVGWKEFNLTEKPFTAFYMGSQYLMEKRTDGILCTETGMASQPIELCIEFDEYEECITYSERLLPVGMHARLRPTLSSFPVLISPEWLVLVDSKFRISVTRFVIPTLEWFDKHFKHDDGYYSDRRPNEELTSNREQLVSFWAVQ